MDFCYLEAIYMMLDDLTGRRVDIIDVWAFTVLFISVLVAVMVFTVPLLARIVRANLEDIVSVTLVTVMLMVTTAGLPFILVMAAVDPELSFFGSIKKYVGQFWRNCIRIIIRIEKVIKKSK